MQKDSRYVIERLLTSFAYQDGVSAENVDALFTPGEDGITGTYTLSREYTEDPIEISLKTANNDSFATTCRLNIVFSEAKRKEASAEEIEAVQKKIAEAKLLLEEDYTQNSYQNLQKIIEEAEAKISVDDPSYDVISGQMNALILALNDMVSLKELKALISEAQSYDTSSYTYPSSYILAIQLNSSRNIVAKKDSTKEDVAEATSNMKSAIGSLRKSNEKLSDGSYKIPIGIYSISDGSNNLPAYFEKDAIVKIANNNMTISLSMMSNNGSWLTDLKYSINEAEVGSEAQTLEKDSDGNVLKYQFTVPYSEDDFVHLWGSSNEFNETKVNLFLDFQNAEEEPEPGEDWVNLTDGTYEIPLDIYYGNGSGQSTINRPFFDDKAKVEVSEGKMTVNLGMKENGGKWITGLKYGAVGGSGGTAAEAAEKDSTDNVLTWRFTMDYTEELIGLWLTKTGASYESTAALYLDFAQAEETEEDEEILQLKEELTELLETCNYAEQDYTEESWLAYKEAYDAAFKLSQDSSEVKENYSEAINNLRDAITNLESKQISEARKKLESLLNDCDEKYFEENFTPESWTIYEEASKTARDVLEDGNRVEQDYEDAIKKLDLAILQLEQDLSTILGNLRTVVEETIDFYENSEIEYEESSYQALLAAIDSADITNSYYLNSDQIDAQIKWIKAEVTALLPKSQISNLATANLIYDDFETGYIWEEIVEEEVVNENPKAENENGSIIIEDELLLQEKKPDSEDTEKVGNTEDSIAEGAQEETSEILEEEKAGYDFNSNEENESNQNENKKEDVILSEEKEEEIIEEEVENETLKVENENNEETTSSGVKLEDEINKDETIETDSYDLESGEAIEKEELLEIEPDNGVNDTGKLMENITETNSDIENGDEEEKASGEEEIAVSMSKRYVPRVMAKATPSNAETFTTRVIIPENGTYTIDFDLWKYDTNSASMGNPSFIKPATMIIKDGNPEIYMQLQGMNYSGLYGHLKEIVLMENISETEDGIKYTTEEPSYIIYSQESDDYGEAGTYPQIVGFPINLYQEYTPVEVNVPVMGSSAIQPARIRIYWDTLTYQSESTNIDGSIDQPEQIELDTSLLDQEITKFENLNSSDYISNSYFNVLKSVTAGKTIKTLGGIRQEDIDNRTNAIKAAMAALTPVASSESNNKLQSMLTEAEQYDISAYTEESYAVLTEAVSEAHNLLANKDFTDGMAEHAIKNLQRAILQLEDDVSEAVKKTELQFWIETGWDYIEAGNYKETGLADLQKILREAEQIYGNENATQDQVTSMVEVIKKQIDSLVINVDKSELWTLLIRAKAKDNGAYTEDSFRILSEAIKIADNVYYNEEADATQVLLAIHELENALNQLEIIQDDSGDVVINSEREDLMIQISLAASYNSSSYTTGSWQVLANALSNARAVYANDQASQTDIKAATEVLKMAISGLTLNEDSNEAEVDDSGSNEDEGYYEVDVDLWHATLNKASMGDPAVNKTAYVYIDEDGDITMRLVTKKMTTSGITTHLYDYYYYEDGDYEEAELISSENSKWIFEFPLPNDNDKYYKCKVDPRVDVMGDDPVKARLKVDWDSLDEVDEDDWNDLEGDVDEDDDDDSTYSSSSSTSGNPTLQSGETGIRIYGNVGGPGIVLEVVKKENGPEYDMTHGAISSQVNRFVLYDVRLKSGTGYVQPTSSVTMQIPIPTGYDTSKLVLYRIGEDGSYTTISGKVNGSYYEATVDHFSLYALAESNQVTETAASSGKDSSSGGSSSSSRTRTTSSRTSGSSRTSSSQSIDSDSSGNHVAAGREIPYTGDPMPVKELMGIGFFAVMICLGTALPDLRRRLGSRKQQEE